MIDTINLVIFLRNIQLVSFKFPLKWELAIRDEVRLNSPDN